MICSSRLRSDRQGKPQFSGHNWRVVVHVQTEELDAAGQVLAPGKLGDELWAVLQPLDHRHLDDLAAFAEPPGPTVPRVARHIVESLQQRLDDGRVRLVELELWTSRTECCRIRLPAA